MRNKTQEKVHGCTTSETFFKKLDFKINIEKHKLFFCQLRRPQRESFSKSFYFFY